MTTDEHSTPEHPTAREKLLQKEETQRTPNIRNSIDGSSISNAIQADQIHGGVHFYSADLRDHLYREEAPAAQAANGQPELETGGNKPRNAFVEYFTRIWKARSPILIWGATMLSLDVAVVGFLEYILGGQRPEEPASEDLNTAQAGSFFFVIFFPSASLAPRSSPQQPRKVAIPQRRSPLRCAIPEKSNSCSDHPYWRRLAYSASDSRPDGSKCTDRTLESSASGHSKCAHY
ncbi:hypothetical protein A8924_5503 [Saccharopolyspora erythraea NRRL 2338]|uniref:hypothetical protein n=1 Tax=Saccharopolyspora erythraea TaxID=1836 RepID=UPI000C002FB4|nr:hypothetical protein [Saccharopolyspora erythraea]PFG98009.1 hypothetical protein A8924_5503 [Saccharopolyspora erythraea NRRL 2338]QRK88130.1 hypothetical protein JQX30_25930 [Saccharopolyspora erythraea]